MELKEIMEGIGVKPLEEMLTLRIVVPLIGINIVIILYELALG
jgi:hypothetical protein